MGACKTQGINTGQRYYFNEVSDVINGTEMGGNNVNKAAAMEQRVSLICSIKNVGTSGQAKVELIIYSDPQRKAGKSAGFTETKQANESNNIIFEKFFTMPYFFERQQLIDLKVTIGSKTELIQTSLGSIMGRRKQTLIKKLQDGTDFEVKGMEIKKSNKIVGFDINISGNMVGMNISYSITNLGTELDPTATKLYDSELKSSKKSANNISFIRCNIPIMFLNTGKNSSNNISIDFKDVKHKSNLGNYNGQINSLISSKTSQVRLAHNLNATINCSVMSTPSFISYLRSGMNINLTIGIDFTGSNGTYTDYRSYHYLNNGMNDYEKAIRSCGDILAYYDDDQLFPVFGFGFLFKNPELNNNLGRGKYDKFNYPINRNESDPNIHLIDNVLVEYRNFITEIKLSGPTNFAPMIRDLNNEVKKNLSNGMVMGYNILLILTDGQIDDLQDTIDEMVEASFLPISVIIVGIGNGDFTSMDILDADENPLYDRRRRKADRDLVQFVPFNQFKNDPAKLAEQVLEEIPRQVVEYYQHKGIKPQDDIEEESTESLINS
jgi:hypothetical protein